MRFAVWLLTPAIAGCATVPKSDGLPSYDPSVTIAREVREGTAGVLHRKGSCVLLRTFGRIEGAQLVPIWPAGTRDEGERLVLPNSAPLPIGKNLSVSGRFVAPTEAALTRLTAGCAGRAFLVESANRSLVWGSPAELVAMADAALVVRVNAVNGRAPLRDGMLTTIDTTVLEAISGSDYESGQRLSLRLPMGIDGPRSAHGTMYGALGDRSGQLMDQRLLLFVVQDLYAEQARVRGGRPLEGYEGGTLFYRLQGDRVINDTDSPAPETLAALRDLVAANRR